MHDIVIKDARVADGDGIPLFRADVAIKDGRISDIGKLNGSARETVDAQGCVLAPGIIDAHTHYDAQLTWDATASPSTALGVTTIVVGNCGLSLAPAPPEYREEILADLAVVEGIPLSALTAGVQWGFEDFAGYLSMLQRRGVVPNVAAFVGHSTVRTVVIGDEASKRAATLQEIEAMRKLVRNAMDAGAVGFSSTQGLAVLGSKGLPMPSCVADPDEFRALVRVLGEVGRGVYLHGGSYSPLTSPELLEELASMTHRPVMWAGAVHVPANPSRGKRQLELCAEATARGHRMYGQTSSEPHTYEFSLQNAMIFTGYKTWAHLQNAPAEQVIAAIKDPEYRNLVRAELAQATSARPFNGSWDDVLIMEAALEKNRAWEGASLTQFAKERGTDELTALFDLALEEELRTLFQAPLLNNDEDAVGELLAHPASLIAFSDAGAHVSHMCKAGFGLRLLGHWVRERSLFGLEEAVRRLTSMPADIYGFIDRGRIARGAHADLILFDPDKVGASPPKRLADFPAGESRIVCDPVGVLGVWINGVRISTNGSQVDPNVRPGQVLTKFAA